jgi:hypothetical protein
MVSRLHEFLPLVIGEEFKLEKVVPGCIEGFA